MLSGSAGAAAVVAIPDMFKHATSKVSEPKPGSAGAFFYIFGNQTSSALDRAVQAGSGSREGIRAASPHLVATKLAALPVKSTDGEFIVLVAKNQMSSSAELKVKVLNARSAACIAEGALTLERIPADAHLLVKPVISSDSRVVALVLSISLATNKTSVNKVDALTNKSMWIPTASWVSHHAIAYFWLDRQTFTGPYDLSDAPSLANTTAICDTSDLFLWTVEELAARSLQKGVLSPIPRLSVFPIGSGTARRSIPVPGPWPGGEPVVKLPTGEIARLVDREGRMQLYSPRTGRIRIADVSGLDAGSARPSPT